ncbi:DsbA family oxidoreductase [Piscinibacter sp.]|jgi:predicted DsbA family dithiol-disulfide isomerase|uniref:DsbA family oxidoreductase n=1 Tax=Piscinibacter sp. TaxID=1903157 RepID=UPI001B7BA9EE|nr:DsbA family oxidoreductase [Piscinibacter sp.]MBK7532149.1 DsbA family oxidoreductase [Piscinibacter sp.]MBL0092798.1 DsbA family oxidoreductase [Piscinibacter sp.]MBP6543755.1 DsbA family oxidoreductase [Piscinibacter sp.]HPG80177.1 DsbA family oxidoreductase [Piscinibacter sp.]
MNTAAPSLKIDFVSDIVCPWCAIGLSALEIALSRLEGEVAVQLHFQPFELHPDMGPEGAEVVPYLSKKYGMSAEQVAQNQQNIAVRGAAVGFEFRMDRRSRTYNTFDAHRLLHWAELEGSAAQQRALKHALLRAHFTEGENPGAREVLLACAAQAGLDAERAAEVVDTGEYADAVRERERLYLDAGIHSVPAVIINDRHLIAGGQPPEVFEQALRQIAAES